MTHGCKHQVLADARPSLIVEVGTWKGLSAVAMARWLQQHSPRGRLVCVDTWLGTTKAWLEPEQQGNTLFRRNGYPTVYFQFLYNVIATGTTDVIIPLPLPSNMGATFLGERGHRPDLVFIDACHEYACVYADFVAWFAILRPGGTLFGDDVAQSGVFAAVQDAAERCGVAFEVRGRYWIAEKPR